MLVHCSFWLSVRVEFKFGLNSIRFECGLSLFEKEKNQNPTQKSQTQPAHFSFSFPAQPSGQRGPAPLACPAPRAAPLYLTDKTGPPVRHPTHTRAQPRSAAPAVALLLLPLTDWPHMADPSPPRPPLTQRPCRDPRPRSPPAFLPGSAR